MKLSRGVRRANRRVEDVERIIQCAMRDVAKSLVPCARVYVSGGEEFAEFRLADVQAAFDLTTDEMVFLLAQAVVEVAPGGTVYVDDSNDAEGLAPIRGSGA